MLTALTLQTVHRKASRVPSSPRRTACDPAAAGQGHGTEAQEAKRALPRARPGWTGPCCLQASRGSCTVSPQTHRQRWKSSTLPAGQPEVCAQVRPQHSHTGPSASTRLPSQDGERGRPGPRKLRAWDEARPHSLAKLFSTVQSPSGGRSVQALLPQKGRQVLSLKGAPRTVMRGANRRHSC